MSEPSLVIGVRFLVIGVRFLVIGVRFLTMPLPGCGPLAHNRHTLF